MGFLVSRNVRNVLKSAVDARKVLPFAFVLMLAFLVAMAWDGFSRTRELLNSQAYVEHTHQVLYEMDAIQDGLQDAREAWLHYILTPEKVDLDTFEESVKQTWMHVDRVASLTADNPEQQERLKQLQIWIAEELQQLRDNLRTTKTLLIYHTPATDFRQDRVRNAVLKFREEQVKILQERNQAAQLRAEEIERSVSIRIGGFSALMAVLFLLVLGESKKLRVAEQTALHAQTRLEGSLQQLQSETENSKLLNELQADLQICSKPAEAYEVVTSYLEKIVPGSGGVVFAVDNSSSLMEVMSSWGDSAPTRHHAFVPDDCCAVRGGRLHMRLEPAHGLSCRHVSSSTPASYICLPLSALGETLGILHVRGANAAVFSNARLTFIQQIGEYTALRLANLRLKEKLQDQSIRDPLTGLYNRRFLETTLEQELHRAAQRHTGLGIIMADIDGFKQFNDRFGHDAGDHVLREVASLLRHAVRGEDIVCRYGGEEFLAVIPDSSPESVCERAEMMRSAISKLELEHAGRQLGKITTSFGVSYSQDGGLSSDVLLRHADDALYDAKRRGCDCVSLSDSVSSLLATEPERPGKGHDRTPTPITAGVASAD